MKVQQLIEQLKKCDPDAEIILQMDPEGNGYWETDSDPEWHIMKGTFWDGEMYHSELTQELVNLGFKEEDIVPIDYLNAKKAVCLMP
jgi:hypothetical protein